MFLLISGGARIGVQAVWLQNSCLGTFTRYQSSVGVAILVGGEGGMCMRRSLINYLNIEKCDDDVCVFLFLHDIYIYMCMVCIGQIISNG